MAKFKKGERVRCTDELALFMELGETGTVRGYSSPDVALVDVDGGGNEAPIHETRLELIKGDSMNVGDVLVDRYGNECKLLAIIDQGIKLYALSENGKGDALTLFGCFYTEQQMVAEGLKPKTDTTVEKSVADLEKELKMQPGTLRIRKD